MTFDPTSVEVTCVTLLKDHCVQVPWEYINVCGYSDQLCKLPHTYTYYTYILRTYYVQNQWSHSLFLNYVQARQKKGDFARERLFDQAPQGRGPGARLRAPVGVQGQCPGGGRGGKAPKAPGFLALKPFGALLGFKGSVLHINFCPTVHFQKFSTR